MATEREIEAFLETYQRSWAEAWNARPAIFHPGGGVRYPGRDELVNPDVSPSMTDRLRQITDDLEMRLLHWAEREDMLFTEWELRCTVGGRPFRLTGINRFQLRGSQALEAVSVLDRMAVAEFLDPDFRGQSVGEMLAGVAFR